MNLKQLTKNEGKLLKFVRLLKNLQANSYHNKLHSALSQEDCQVIFFGMSLPDDYKKLAKVFRNVPFHFCSPDEFIADQKTLCNIPVIKLSALKNFAAKDNVLVLTRHEALPSAEARRSLLPGGRLPRSPLAWSKRAPVGPCRLRRRGGTR